MAAGAVDLAPASLIIGLLQVVLVNMIKDVNIRSVALVLFERRRKNLGVFLAPGLCNILTPNPTNKSVVQADPFASILTTDINGVVAATSVLAMMVDDADEAILGQATLCHHDIALVRREDLARNLQVERVSNLFPDLLGASGHTVVLEPLQVKDKNWRHGFNKDLFGSCDIGSAGRIEVPLNAFRLSESFESIDNIVDLRSSNVQLKWLVGLEGHRSLVTRHPEL